MTTEPALLPPGLSPEVEALLALPAGATFLHADLQVHTPIDPHFDVKPEPKDPADRMALARSYLGKAKERGIKLVGITEHNDVSWIDELRAAARELDVALLPGFEVESAEGVHVLCLFDPNTTVADLEDCLAGLDLTKAKRQKNRLEHRANMHLRDLAPFIQTRCRGICIAAHVESDKGLLKALQGGARVDAWKTPELLAAQIAKPPHEITSSNKAIILGQEQRYERDRELAFILTSDCRTHAAIGTQSTWIKMGEIGVEGLRQAFLDPDSRIAYENPRELRQGARLLAVSWEAGFLENVRRFAFNPELNCLIGGKGTGKSTVIESIRYAFDDDYHVAEVGKSAKELLGYTFQSGSKISVVVETDVPSPKRYLIERTAPHAPVVRDMLGNVQPDLDPLELLQPCIYGQKEIYEIAQRPPALLSLLDGFAADELREPVETERALLERSRENAQIILDTERRIDDAETKLGELPSLDAWRTRFKEAGFEELLRERRQLDREERLLDGASEALRSRMMTLDRLRAAPEPLAQTLDPVEDEQLPNQKLIADARVVLETADARWDASLDELRAELVHATNELERVRTSWAERRAARSTAFDKALRDLQTKMPDVDPERYLDVERRIEQLTPLRDVVKQLKTTLADARKERANLLIELAEARGERYRVRDRAAQRLNVSLDGSLVVKVTYQGERDVLVRRLSELKTGARAETLRRMVDRPDFTPASFVQHVRSRSLTAEFGIPAGQAGALERALREQTLLELEVEELSDRVELELDIDLGDGHDYRSLDRLSPGQKSTAILLLIMQESRDPLLVDQPEDDLDNRFIYDDIVKRLRKAKPKRQFLIATHNANIPVLGDAEQIVALDAREFDGPPVKSFIRAQGSIDSAQVREAAEEILEGGHDAFELRQAKYRV